ncbi:MAG: ATPase inhibitor subunit zeta [Rickettsiales endosymbiont of Dermacentor nuttalli]
MNKIDDREQAYENKFAHDAEIEFKINARINKMLGFWAASKMNMDHFTSNTYATNLVEDCVKNNYSEDDLVNKIYNDIQSADVNIDISEIKSSIIDIKKEAESYVKNS